jgi:hypothetical protein
MNTSFLKSNPLKKSVTVFGFSTLMFLSACGSGGESQGTDGSSDPETLSTVVATSTLPIGDADCPDGGILVHSGIDENGNGQLDPEEADTVEKVCHGASGESGLNALVEMVDLPPGDSNCPFGGVELLFGLDADGDGVLDSDEVEDQQFLCDEDVPSPSYIIGASGDPVSLDGSWATGCVDLMNGTSQLRSGIASGKSVVHTDEVFTNVSDCSGSYDYSLLILYSFNLEGEVTVTTPLPDQTPVIAAKIAEVYIKFEYTVNSQNTVDIFNDTSWCGFSDWELGVPKDVIGTGCVPYLQNDAFYIDDTVLPNVLYIGSLVPYPDYPTELQPYFYTRQ